MGKQFVNFAFCLSLLLTVCGCSSVPPDNAEFAELKGIRDLEGVYNNYGEGEPNTRYIYLSRIIWPDAEGLRHYAIQFVDIKAVNEKSLLVKGIAENGEVLKEGVFIEGTDFDMGATGIPLSGHYGFPYPVVGVSYQSPSLGVDIKNNGKCKIRTTRAGLLALAIPLAYTETEEFRFLRMK